MWQMYILCLLMLLAIQAHLWVKTRDSRKLMADAVYNLIVKIQPTIISIVVDKEKYFAKYSQPEPVKAYIHSISHG